MGLLLAISIFASNDLSDHRQEVVCPKWISENSDATAPEGTSISEEQEKRNMLRCYWTVVKRAESSCKRFSAKVLCEARTARWLNDNFKWTPSPGCQDGPRLQFKNIMINIRRN
tara:strand:+ start:102 stop:443 length:342 start_codon:yes stop_codon:yes gene_type:complete